MSTLPQGTPLPVRFAQNFACTDQEVSELHAPKPETRWCLLELPKEELEALEAGTSFYFQAQSGGKGLDDGGAALCTNKATFSLEFLENSNSLFVSSIGQVNVLQAAVVDAAEFAKVTAEHNDGMEPKEDTAEPAKDDALPKKDGSAESAPALEAEVFAQCRGQMIVKPVKVNVNRLQELLACQALSENAEDVPVQMLNIDQLAYKVAASPGELQALLDAGPYVEVDGFWRLLPTQLEHEIIDTTASLVTARGWKHEDIDAAELLREVQSHLGQHAVPSLAVLRKALRSVQTPQEKEKQTSATQTASQAASQATQVPDGGADTTADTAMDTSGGVATDTTLSSKISLEKPKLDRFMIVQLLKKPPSQVRDRFQLPPPEPRAKRARQNAGAGRGSDGLQLKELGMVLQATSGETGLASNEQVVALLGENAYVDELEGTVHNLPASMLAPEPKARLARLFDLTSHWRPERLAELLTPVLPAGTKVAAWLLKNSRAVHVELEAGKEERMLVKKFGMG